MAALLLGGGASRADVFGQVLVRSTAWAVLIVVTLFGERPRSFDARPVVIILAAAVLLAAVQLVPLPPSLWQSLPGRAVLLDAAVVSRQPQPWRPWTMVPGATINALSSLIVPVATVVLLSGLRSEDRARIPGLVLLAISFSALAGLLQLSGVGVDNPLVNETQGQVSGLFANRNHFALFLAVGCLLLPVWATQRGKLLGGRGLAAFGLLMVFVLMIVGIGSRAGLIFAVMSLGIGGLLIWPDLVRATRRLPRWSFIAFILITVAIVAVLVLVSVSADRAESVSRALSADPSQDMRRRALPTVWAMTRAYFPFGSGLGGFDPVFRINEPFDLLKLTYFNHAHNDLLEIALDAGVPAFVLVAGAISWWLRATITVWWEARARTARLGSAILFVVLVASVFDYPARTPIIMSLAVIAGWWLARGSSSPALPARGDHL